MDSPTTRLVESPYLRSLIAGGIAGTTVDTTLFPLDTLKTRLQSSAGFSASGGFRGVYAGLGSAVVGSAPGAALFFVSYDSIKRLLASSSRASSNSPPSALQDAFSHSIAASLGEIAACAVRVPTEVVKQRAQAGQSASSAAALRAILDVRRSHGFFQMWRELYRGWGITVFREVPFTVIQFPLWEWMKTVAARRRQGPGADGGGAHGVGATGLGLGFQISAWESALYGSASGAVAAGLTTPLDVLKTRMMLAQTRQSTLALTRGIYEREGLGVFFKGIGPRTMWISIGGAIFLGSYQWAINAME